jgi:hypothetical protein
MASKTLALFALVGWAVLWGVGAHCTGPPLLPDPRLSPGDTLDVTKADICVPGYSKKVRNVPQSLKEQVYREYGITHRDPGEYEIDHIISLELGGSNSIRNLFPESFKTQPWNAHVKDQLENKLHKEVCEDGYDLKSAQREISTNWIEAYKKHFHTAGPLSERAAARLYNARSSRPSNHATSPGSMPPPKKWSILHPFTRPSSSSPAVGNGQVWVNTKSGAYWKPGTRYYGKTKQGKYMKETDAIKSGYHAAGGH